MCNLSLNCPLGVFGVYRSYLRGYVFSRVHLLQNSLRMLILVLRQLGSCLRAWKNLHDHPQHARLSALADRLVWDRRHSTSQALSLGCLCPAVICQTITSATVTVQREPGEFLRWQMERACISILLLLINWCLVGELRASVSPQSAGVSWEVHGLKCGRLGIACWGVTSSFSPSMDCLTSSLCAYTGWMHRIAQLHLHLALIPPGRLKGFFLVFVSAQASHFGKTSSLLFDQPVSCLGCSFIPWALPLLLSYVHLSPDFFISPDSWWLGVWDFCFVFFFPCVVLLSCLPQSAISFCSIQVLMENHL